MILERMAERLKQFTALLADNPQDDPALALWSEGHSINQVVSRLAPQLGGPALVRAQNAIEHQARGLMHYQAETVEQLQAALEEWQEYAGKLEAENAKLRAALATRQQVAPATK
jgi:hypothetical protein